MNYLDANIRGIKLQKIQIPSRPDASGSGPKK
jgi:hypothetical protein